MNSGNQYYQFDIKKTLEVLSTQKEGIDEEESAERLKIYGKNKLKQINKTPLIFKFLYQLKDLMVMLLIGAGSISLYLNEYRDAIIMFTLVLINALIGFFQEFKAERMMDSLKTMMGAKAKVNRNDKIVEIDAVELVPGDIVQLEEGDAVPADVRVMEENNFATNDFALTGESNPTKKFVHEIKGFVQLGDRNNIVFMGTTVATGNAIGIVVATGMDTELGRLANLSQETTAENSPLQKELNTLAKKLSIISLILGVILFAVGMIFIHFSLREALLFALGMAVSTVPEGLPAQVSIALSLAAARLAKENAIVKKLSAVETLGSTHIICTDKTGTLTKNEMTVQFLVIGKEEFSVSGLGYEPKGNILDKNGKALSIESLKKHQIFFETGIFSGNAKVNPPDDEHEIWYGIGDPTEAALVTLAAKATLNPNDLNKKHKELKEFTFDAVRKRMSSIREKDGKIMVYVKGSPESLIKCCTHFWDEGEIKPMTQEHIDYIQGKDNEFATKAMRNLGYAYREIEDFKEGIEMKDVEKNLIWLGVVSMVDPLREEVKAAVEAANKAHIRVIIITGDYALTAEAIAKQIWEGDDAKFDSSNVITGAQLEAMSDVDLLHHLIATNLIFARTSPENKLRIVDLLKRAGEVVAVTGDGVNDSPALKKADIGLAMGKTGTQVAKDSAEIVLLDDSFNTIVTAIAEGRTIFQNLKKTILSSITSNGAELFVVLLSLIGAMVYDFPLAILVVQILAIDLIGEMLPLTFLTWDPPQEEVMTAPPRNSSEHILNKKSMIDLSWSGFLMGALGYVNFLLLFKRENESLLNISADGNFYMRATTLTYVTIVFAQWMNILSRRTSSNETVFTSYVWSNKKLLLGYLISLILILNIVYNPVISPYLRTAPLMISDWIFAVIAALIFLTIREIYKKFSTRRQHN